MSTHAKQRTCIYCGRTLGWRANGERMRDGSWVRLDERGLRWAGRRCPDCEKARVSAAVRCDGFERAQVVRRLEADGFAVTTTSLPLNVEKHGQKHRVSVRRAYVEGSGIVVENALAEDDDLVALVFTSVRIMTAEQLRKMGDKLLVHEEKKRRENSSSAKEASKELPPTEGGPL